jgi:hypothetical protein
MIHYCFFAHSACKRTLRNLGTKVLFFLHIHKKKVIYFAILNKNLACVSFFY